MIELATIPLLYGRRGQIGVPSDALEPEDFIQRVEEMKLRYQWTDVQTAQCAWGYLRGPAYDYFQHTLQRYADNMIQYALHKTDWNLMKTTILRAFGRPRQAWDYAADFRHHRQGPREDEIGFFDRMQGIAARFLTAVQIPEWRQPTPTDHVATIYGAHFTTEEQVRDHEKFWKDSIIAYRTPLINVLVDSIFAGIIQSGFSNKDFAEQFRRKMREVGCDMRRLHDFTHHYVLDRTQAAAFRPQQLAAIAPRKGRSRGSGSRTSQPPSDTTDYTDYKCHHCRKMGHIARYCPARAKKADVASAAGATPFPPHAAAPPPPSAPVDSMHFETPNFLM